MLGECPKEECIWGYDEASWYASLNEADRGSFLVYAWNWLRENDPNGFVEVLGMRDIQFTSDVGIDWYFANSDSAMTYGYNQEKTIKKLWQ